MPKYKEDKSKYAERLRHSLKILQISYREAARRADVPFRSLDNWVRGLSIPRADQLAALAKIGINPNYILLGEGPPILDKKKRPTSPISKGKRGSAMISPTLSSA